MQVDGHVIDLLVIGYGFEKHQQCRSRAEPPLLERLFDGLHLIISQHVRRYTVLYDVVIRKKTCPMRGIHPICRHGSL